MDISGAFIKGELVFKETYKVFDSENVSILIDGKTIEKNYETEILNLYKQYGASFANKLTDFIAVYLFDKNINKLFLINDRMGTKSIYYHISKDGDVYFANDLMLLMNNYHIDKQINSKSLSMYFRYQYVPSPITIFESVYKVKNGHYVSIDKHGVKEESCYWNMFDIFNNKRKKLIKNSLEIENEIENKIKSFANKYLTDNKTTGVYLSGGIDTSVLSSIVASSSKEKVNTFSIGFSNKLYNEAEKAKKIAADLQTNHHEFYLNQENAFDLVKRMPEYYTEPLGDASQVATVAANEFAHKNGMNIALTGDGADQLFCGAGIYDQLYKIQKLKNLLNPLGIRFKFDFLKKRKKLFAIFYKMKNIDIDQFDILFDEKKISGLIKNDSPQLYDFSSKIKTRNIQERRMILDLNTFMPDRVLTKMHIAANKNNIEMRSPYLTKDFIEYTFQIGHKLKYHKGIKKYILKNVLYKYLSREYFDNVKRGFAIPTAEWLNTCLNEDLKRLSTEEFIKKQNIFNYDKVQTIINNIGYYAHLAWCYYMFQLWYEKYMM